MATKPKNPTTVPGPESQETRCYVIGLAKDIPKCAGMFPAMVTIHHTTRHQADLFTMHWAEQMGDDTVLAMVEGDCHCQTPSVTGAKPCGRTFHKAILRARKAQTQH